MEQTFKKLQEEWEGRVFQLDKVTLSDGLTPPGKTTEGSVLEYQSDRQHNYSDTTFVIAGKRQKAFKIIRAE